MRTVQQLFDLSGQTALITGGSRGLGREIAEGMAEAGASLMLLARREQWPTPAVEEFRQRGFRCEGQVCDAALPAWRMVIDVNLTGAFLFCQAVGRQMVERGRGRIVNISSINALTGGLLMADVPNASYVASKGGLTALIGTLQFWAPRVTAVLVLFDHDTDLARHQQSLYRRAQHIAISGPVHKARRMIPSTLANAIRSQMRSKISAQFRQ
jgi:NAD(P)-dependent dehydrogenase (short-subunit alcohol dehydrogenase family)